MAAHGMAGDGLARHVGGEIICDHAWQFLRDVAFHLVVLVPRRLCGIDIKSGTAAQFPVIRRIGNRFAARGSIGAHDDHAQLRRRPTIFTFLHHIGMGAGQA